MTCELQVHSTSNDLTDILRTRLNAVQSPLLRLPAEIRLEIWTLLHAKVSHPEPHELLDARDTYGLEGSRCDDHRDCLKKVPRNTVINVGGYAWPSRVKTRLCKSHKLAYNVCTPKPGRTCSWGTTTIHAALDTPSYVNSTGQKRRLCFTRAVPGCSTRSRIYACSSSPNKPASHASVASSYSAPKPRRCCASAMRGRTH